MLRAILFSSFIAFGTASAVAQPAGNGYRAALTEEEIVVAARESFERLIERRTGKVTIAGGLVTLNVPAGYYYLNPHDSQRVLVEAWHNPIGAPPLGLLMQEGISAIDEDSWGVVITLENIGHVSDPDAAQINYADVLRNMQTAQTKRNLQSAERAASPVEIVGWAKTPRYDPASHSLAWATDLKVGDNDAHALDYNLRILGRDSVLSLQFFASMKDLKRVEQALTAVLAIPEFNSGHRYGEFDPKTDRKAGFGVAGLIESSWPPAGEGEAGERGDPT